MLYPFVFIFGLLIGSFLNCLIWRLHKEESIMGRSYCPICRAQIHWFDNIPVLSFLLLTGKCRHCKSRISIQYPVIELAIALLFLWSFQLHSTGQLDAINLNIIITILRDWVFIFSFVLVFVYDLRWMLIPDQIVIPASIIILAINLFLGVSMLNLLLSLIVGVGFFLIQYLVSSGKWIGGGDIRLGFLLGAYFSLISELTLAILLAYFIGSIVGITLILAGRKKWGSKLPLGVFLACSAMISMFFASEILSWYWGWF